MRHPALALLLLGVATACSSGSSPQATASAAPPSASAPAATTPPASSTTTPPAPPAPPAPSSAATPPAVVVTGAGTRLTAPADPTTKAIHGQQTDRCFGLLDAGYTAGSCQRYTSKLGTAIGLVEKRGTDERSLVFTVTGTRASLALRATRTVKAGSSTDTTSLTEIRVSDLANDSTDKAVFLTPQGDGYESLAEVDVVEASGTVVIHRALKGGTAGKAFGGGLETYVPTASGKAQHQIIRYQGSGWRIVSSETVSSDKAKDAGDF